jgi:hypothetical protein
MRPTIDILPDSRDRPAAMPLLYEQHALADPDEFIAASARLHAD